MRKYLHINLNDRSVDAEELQGEDIVRVGRHFIAKTLLAAGAATVDPLSPENPLIFSVGPFAGSNFSNGNRVSVGCKSPLTGGIKEANSGGSFGFALGQLEICGLTLNGAASDWVVIRIKKGGDVDFEPADAYLGKGNVEAARMLFEKYGDKVSLGLCGPVGEYQGLMAGVAFTDPEGRPERLAARGGVGAVMGSKKVKAIVADMDKMPTFHDRKKYMGSVREYGKMLSEEPQIETFTKYGTAMMGDLTNKIGGFPTRNFSSGQLSDPADGPMKLGGDYIRERNLKHGGHTEHACMPGCMIKCSNIYADEDGNDIVAPLEYESICLMGSNCGLDDPDNVARANAWANDLGVDSIEAGATLGVLMEAGEGEFGDYAFMERALNDMLEGNENGRIYAQGAERVGKHFGVHRVPTVKGQAISAYDPRVIEVTGISMMTSAQGADHTAGNVPVFDSKGKTTEELMEVSFGAQIGSAAADSLGLCIFGRAVTLENLDFVVEAVNQAAGTELDASFFMKLGREALEMEWEFNKQAGFTPEDDELPAFFYDEALDPTGNKARHHGPAANARLHQLLKEK